jgi:4-amino-4-deoxy-L-arabinose transferase-like glycosyltransferase
MAEPLKKSTLIMLTGIILFHIVVNMWWWQLNIVPLPWDQANHTQLAQQLFYCFSETPFSTECWKVSNYYPIATHLSAALLFVITGPSGQSAQYLGTVYFIAAILGVFCFFYESTRKQRLALLTATIFSLIPVITDVSRYLMTDMPLLAFTFWCMYWLRRTKHFTAVIPTLIAFGLAGLAVFTKWYGAFYLVVPFIWELVAARKVLFSAKHRTTIWKNLALGAIVAAVIALPWYVLNFKSMLEQTLYYAGADDSQAKNVLSFEALTWYIMLAFRYQLFPPFFVLMTVGLVTFIVTERNKEWRWYVILFLLAEYIIFTFFGNKAIRYTFHLVVMYGFLIAYALEQLIEYKKWVGVAVGGVAISYLLFLCITLSFGWPVKSYRYLANVPLLGWTELVNISDDPIRGVDSYEWPVETVADDILQLGKNNPGSKVLILVDYPYFNTSNLMVALLEKSAPDQLPIFIEGPESRATVLQQAGPGAYFAEYDYIIVTTNEVGHDWHRGVFERGKAQQYLLSNVQNFNQVKQYRFPLEDLLPAIIEGQNLPGNRLVRQKACQKQRCDQLLLLEPKTPTPMAGGVR